MSAAMATASVRAARAGQPRRFDQVLLEVRGITLRFGGVAALTDVSFDIRKARFARSSAPTAPASRRC